MYFPCVVSIFGFRLIEICYGAYGENLFDSAAVGDAIRAGCDHFFYGEGDEEDGCPRRLLPIADVRSRDNQPDRADVLDCFVEWRCAGLWLPVDLLTGRVGVLCARLCAASRLVAHTLHPAHAHLKLWLRLK